MSDTSAAALQYGVSLYSYTGEYGVTMTLDDCVEDVADLGATGLEILGEAHIEDYPSPPTAWLDAWFARLDRFGLTPTCYGSWVDHRRFPGRDITEDEAVQQLETDIRLAAQLGFKYVRPKLGVVTSDLEPHPVWEPATLRVLDLAEEQDVIICPEIHWPSVIRSKVVDDYIALIERTGTKHFGLLMDTGVFQKSMHHRSGGVREPDGPGLGAPADHPRGAGLGPRGRAPARRARAGEVLRDRRCARGPLHPLGRVPRGARATRLERIPQQRVRR